ncbi:3-hydroxyacyl-ACP dehydratase [Amycolatopsis sp. NPDC004079]|uniref:3-hydroxyacyl-ACP dehydratase FabZ family protein n=1 Tax=Amycolatopsis sp. NPDC004079 TaxID=3154549 RepID=UPI0033AE268C
MTAADLARPLRAVDRLEIEPVAAGGRLVRAWKLVTAADPYLGGHFPGLTIYPGLFLLETLHQAVLETHDGALPRIRRVRSIRCLSPVFEGHTVRVDAMVEPERPGAVFEVRARCFRDDRKVATLSVEFGRAGDRDG